MLFNMDRSLIKIQRSLVLKRLNSGERDSLDGVHGFIGGGLEVPLGDCIPWVFFYLQVSSSWSERSWGFWWPT